MAVRNFDLQLLGLNGKPVVLVDVAGKPILDEKGDPRIFLLKDAVVGCLTSQLPGDNDLSGTERCSMMSLAIRVTEGGPREYTIEELNRIKARLEKQPDLPHLQLFRVTEHINSDPPVEKSEDNPPKSTSE